MNNKAKKQVQYGYIAAIAVLAVACVGLLIWAINLNNDVNKYEKILELSCDYSGSSSSCRQGIKMFKTMPLEEIEALMRY